MRSIRQIELDRLAKLRMVLVQARSEMRADSTDGSTQYKAIGDWLQHLDAVIAALKNLDGDSPAPSNKNAPAGET